MGDVFQTYDAHTIFRYAIAVTVFVASLLAIFYVIWWGLLMVVSGGDEGKVKSAVNHMRYAVVGVVVLVLVLFVAPVFFNIFGLNTYSQHFQPAVIFNTIQEISARFLGGGMSPAYVDNAVISPNDDDFTKL